MIQGCFNIDATKILKTLELYDVDHPGELDKDLFLKIIKDEVNKLIQKADNLDDITKTNAYSQLSEDIYNVYEDWMFPSEFLENNKTISTYLLNQGRSNIPEPQEQPSKVDAISDPRETNTERKRRFITRNYHTSTGAIKLMRQNFYTGMNTAVLIGIKQFVSGRHGINAGIRNYQEDLLTSVIDYLLQQPNVSEETKSILEEATLYDDDGNYTGILETIAGLEATNQLLKHSKSLDSLYQSYVSATPNEKDIITLDAYNAYFILRYFDDLIKEEIPEIDIVGAQGSYDTRHIAGNLKYQFGRMAHTSTNWRDDKKDFDASKELSKPLQIIVETTDIYEFSTNEKRNGEKLSLKDFNRIISTIKKIASCEWALDKFNTATKKIVNDIFPGKNYNTLHEIIGDLNNDAALNYMGLFKLLSSGTFWSANGVFATTGTGKTINSIGLEKYDLNLIWSIYKRVFERHAANDVRNWSLLDRFIYNPDPDESHNYFYYLIQAFTSIESFQLQQYRENEQGFIVNQTLRDNVNISSRRVLENMITSSLSSLLPGKLKNLIDKFNPNRKTGDLSEFFLEDGKIKFKLGNSFEIIVNPKESSLSNGHVKIIDTQLNKEVVMSVTDTTKYSMFNKEKDLKTKLLPFINAALEPLGLTDNPEIIDLYLSYSDGNAKGLYRLTSLSASILANGIIQNVLKDEIRNGQITSYDGTNSYSSRIFDIYGSKSPRINKSSLEFRTLVNEELVPELAKLNQAYKVFQGIYGDNSVRDSQGKTISQVGVSMLITKIENQVQSQNKKPNSASRHFTLWNTRGLYRDAQFTREYAGLEEQKVGIKFNTSEQFISQFIYDFIGGYLDNTESKQRFVSIMPSIISDKSRILKLILDFKKASIQLGRKNVKFVNLTADEWKTLASQSLGQFYANIWQDSLRTFDKLTSFVQARNYTLQDGSQLVISPGDNFKIFNQWLSEQKLSAEDGLHKLIAEYQAYAGEDLEIIRELHYTFEGSRMVANRLLLSQIYKASDGQNIELRTVNTADSIKYELGDFMRFVQSKDSSVNLLIPSTYTKKYEGITQLQAWAKQYYALTGIPISLNKYFKFSTGGSLQINASGTYEYTESLRDVIGDVWFESIEGYKQSLEAEGKTPNRFLTKDQFWKIKTSDLVRDILDMRDPIMTVTRDGRPIESPEFKYIEKDKNKNHWIASGTGAMVLAKLISVNEEGKETARIITSFEDITDIGYHKDGKYIRATDDKFNFYEYIENCNGRYVRFEVNPYLDLWNSSDYAISQEYMNSSVGTFLNHPSKKLKKKGAALADADEEAERWMAQVKRNVSLSATKHEFVVNLVNGIRDTYRIAVIKDVKADVFNIQGQFGKGGATVHDGSTIVSGTTNYLENNSLGGSSAGTDKKQFVHGYKENTGNGIIIKTAGFAITNSRIRQSEFLEMLNYKMMKGRWKTIEQRDPADPKNILVKGGQTFLPDITKSFYTVNGVRQDIHYDDIIFKEGKKFFRVTGINYLGDGKYTRDLIEVDATNGSDIIGTEQKGKKFEWSVPGTDIKSEVVDNNFALWSLFGGKYAYEVQVNDITGERRLINSESSFKNLVTAMNNISQFTFDKNNPPLSQSQIHQNLKYSNIDYVVTEGAIKQGAANVNSNKAYTDLNYELTTMSIKMLDAGIQLDAEHEADDSTISLMTQVVNALCARGYTLDECSDVYEAMLELTRISIEDYIEGISQYFSAVDPKTGKPLGDNTKLKDALARTIVKALSNTTSRDSNLLQAISETVVQTAKEGKLITARDLATYVPADHPAIFNQLSSAISSALTKKGVRIKFNGSLAVLNPSHGIYRLHGDRLRDEVDPETLDEMQKKQKSIDKAQMLMGHNYLVTLKDGRIMSYANSDPFAYWELMDKYADQIVDVKEDVKTARDLATYQFNFKGKNDKYYNQWDLDIVRALFTVRQNEDAYSIGALTRVQKALEDPVSLLSYIESSFEEGDRSQFIGEDGNYSIEKFKEYVNEEFGIRPEIISQLNLQGISDINGLIGRLKRIVQKTLDAVSNGKQDTVIINGQEVVVDKESLDIHDYECIMPKIYKTDFGLETGDRLSDILAQKDLFFLNKLLKHWYSLVSDDLFDLELKHADGSHIYILDRKHGIPKGLKLAELKAQEVGYDNDKLYRYNSKGDKLYELSSDKDEIYVDANGHEVIVTDSPKFYVHSQRFNSIRMSDKVANDTNQFNDILEVLAPTDPETKERKPIDNKIVQSYLETIKYDANEVLTFNKYHQMDKVPPAQLQKIAKSKEVPPQLSQLIRSSKEVYTSFEQSLKIVAGRIPAQSMQSFMAMKVVGFDDSDLNSVYVNYWQIWLQGSDFDIDKVSLLGFNFGKDSKFVEWSNLFSLESPAHLQASLTLPYPKANLQLQVIPVVKEEMSDEEYQEKTKLFFDIMEDMDSSGSILRNDGQFKKYMSPSEIKTASKIIRALNQEGGVLHVPDSWLKELEMGDKTKTLKSFGGRVGALKRMYDSHNTYIKYEGHSKQAIMNFISAYMYEISRNPRNLIQSQSSVDDLTGFIKELASKSPSDTRTTRYSPGNVISKLEMLILTLTGKENVGIVASAMKTFEALSYYYYKNLRDCIKLAKEGNEEEALKKASRLLFNGKDGKQICGKVLNLLANTYTDEDITSLTGSSFDTIKKAYQNVDNDIDAFLLVSALLSLATDNAKDPTLAKINAGPDLLGLYTAGLSIGLDMETLIGTVMSNTGLVINRLIEGNVFNMKKKLNLNQALDYIMNGPSLRYAPKSAVTRLSNMVKTSVIELAESVDIVDILGTSLSEQFALNIKTPSKTEQEWRNTEATNGMTYNEWAFRDKVLTYLKNENTKLSKTTLQKIFNHLIKKGSFYTNDGKTEKGTQILTDIIVGAIKTQTKEYQSLGDGWKAARQLRKELEQLSGENATPEEIVSKEAAVLQQEDTVRKIQENNKALKQEKIYLNNLLQEYKSYSNMYQAMQNDFLLEGGVSVNLTKHNRDGFYVRLRKESDCHRVGDYYAVTTDDADGVRRVTGAVQLLGMDNEKEINDFYDIPYEERKGKTAPKLVNPKWSEVQPVFRAWNAIRDLNEINAEMGRLREKLSLNQGMPNAFADQLSVVIKFENTLTDRANEILNSTKSTEEQKDKAQTVLEAFPNGIDLHNFLYVPEYQEKVINAYESIKCVFNIMDVAVSVPHYRGYLETLDALVLSESVNALVYRKVKELTPIICNEFNYKGTKKISEVAKKLSKFFENKMTNIFLQSTNQVAILSPGSYMFDSNQKITQVTEPTPIELGTPNGNASFKLWVEQEVIPNLKRGINNSKETLQDPKRAGIVKPNANNTLNHISSFIRSLVTTKNDKTYSGNSIVSYSLPINMIPRSEQEQLRFDQYKQQFNQLDTDSYYYQYVDENGDLRQKAIPVQDILFLYNLITYGNESNQRAFTNLFEAVIRDGSLDIYNKYLEFLAHFGQYENLDEGLDYTKLEAIEFCAPIDNPFTSRLPYIRVFHPDYLKYVLMRRKQEESIVNVPSDEGMDNEAFEDVYGLEEDPTDDGAPDVDDDYGNGEEGSKYMAYDSNIDDSPYEVIFGSKVDENFFLNNIESDLNLSDNDKHKMFLDGNSHITYKIAPGGKVQILSLHKPGKMSNFLANHQEILKNDFSVAELIQLYKYQIKEYADSLAVQENGLIDEELRNNIIDQFRDRIPTEQDFIVENITTSIDGVNNLIPSRVQIKALIDELFNMCP